MSARIVGALNRVQILPPSAALTVAIRGRLHGVIAPGFAHQIHGTVSVNGLPVRRLVRLYRLDTGALVFQGKSRASDGGYAFTGLPNMRYFVLAHDDLENFNAAIADLIEPEPMP